MRDPQQIERELDLARTDLENNIVELKDLIQDKLDFKAHARRALAVAERKASEAATRGKYQLDIWFQHARTLVRDNPMAVAGVLGAALVLGTVVLVDRRRAH